MIAVDAVVCFPDSPVFRVEALILPAAPERLC